MLGWALRPPWSVVLPQEKPVTVAVVPMLFPADPAVLAVTVTTAPLEVAVTAATFVLIADARLAASVVISADVAKLVPLVLPSAPPVSNVPAQPKPARVFPSPMLLPAVPFVLAVTVVVLPLAVAVTPAATGQAMIASLRFVASVPVVLLMAKVPVVALVQVFVPLLPVAGVPQEKWPKASAPDKAISVPGVVAVIVVTPAVAVEVAPTAGKEPLQELIASLRLAAAVPTVLLLTKFPTVALVHPFVSEPPPSVPPDQPNPLVKV